MSTYQRCCFFWAGTKSRAGNTSVRTESTGDASVLDSSFLKPQSLDQFLPQEWTQSKNSFPCDDSICAAWLVVAVAIHKSSPSIHFHTPKDIFWPGNSAVVWRVPLIRYVNPSTPSSTAHAALIACATSSISRVHSAYMSPGGRGHDTGLRDNFGIFMRMLGDDGMENIEESRVFFQG
jgi:hypothetical protein